MGSAKEARRRLEVIITPTNLTYKDWLGRLKSLLALRNLRVEQFPELDFASYHRSGIRVMHVAETVIGSEKGRQLAEGV